MLEIDELEIVVSAACQLLKERMFVANREYRLTEFMESIQMEDLMLDFIDESNDEEILIAVVGKSDISQNEILRIFKEHGISERQIELYLDYKKAKKIDYRKFWNTDRYSYIFFGPIPHSCPNKDDSSSIISRVENMVPAKVKRLGANQTLKITENSLRQALASI